MECGAQHNSSALRASFRVGSHRSTAAPEFSAVWVRGEVLGQNGTRDSRFRGLQLDRVFSEAWGLIFVGNCDGYGGAADRVLGCFGTERNLIIDDQDELVLILRLVVQGLNGGRYLIGHSLSRG